MGSSDRLGMRGIGPALEAKEDESLDEVYKRVWVYK